MNAAFIIPVGTIPESAKIGLQYNFEHSCLVSCDDL
jgi:hypothetical protein